MVEAVAMTITGAPEMGMVEVEKVTQAAEVMSTQVAGIGLEDKTEASRLPWKGATLLHAIHTAAQAAEPPEVAAEEEVALIEVVAEADTETFETLGPNQFFSSNKKERGKFYLHSQRTTETLFLPLFLIVAC